MAIEVNHIFCLISLIFISLHILGDLFSGSPSCLFY